jgi:hypothetical protein
MYTVPFVGWIANAAARLMGPHGAVTEQAQKSGCSRQSVYDHAQKVKVSVAVSEGTTSAASGAPRCYRWFAVDWHPAGWLGNQPGRS